jgi:hypothetical protein
MIKLQQLEEKEMKQRSFGSNLQLFSPEMYLGR